MSIELNTLREWLRSLGAKNCHQDRLLRLWTGALAFDTPASRPEHHLPLRLKESMPAIADALSEVARIVSRHPADDGSLRLLIRLADGQTVETVLLPRGGLCISSQVGCAVGCLFCMTGRSGLLRQLSSLEMLAQVVLARHIRPVRKVVFMGMGEPAHNLAQVLECIDLLGSLGGIAHKSLVFSTVGDPRVFEQLPQQNVKPALALSLHSTDPTLRARLLPSAPRIEPEALVHAAQAYALDSGYPTQYQWTLLEGINDSTAEIDGLTRLLTGCHGVLNLIPFNQVDGAGFRRPTPEHCESIARTLNSRGILTKLRRSAGQDVQAGCGQLRARVIPICT